MKEIEKQSDIEEIIRRLRGGKGMPSETPFARKEPPQKEPVAPPEEHSFQARERAEEYRPNLAETSALEKELAFYRQKEASWNKERDLLRKEQKILVQEEKESFSAHFKLLEEKLLSLAGEKESVTGEIKELKSLLEVTQKRLDAKDTELQETKSILSKEETDSLQKSQELSELHKEKERLTHKEESLSTQITLLNNALFEEKHHKEIISLSVKTNQDHIGELRAELASLHNILQEKEGRYLSLQHEKEKTEVRTREVEDLLVLKLASIHELEEELTGTCARVEELEEKNKTQEDAIHVLTEEKTMHESTIQLLHDEIHDYKGRISRANEYISEIRRKTESLDRVKNVMDEASTHVHALSNLFGPTPQSIPSLRNLVESFVVRKSGGSLSQGAKEQIEQKVFF